eukprot:gnl/MRDRNA2_/MRDRNA2_94122_c0_seq1.p1 gnl/MRDRNA2_/MRDRNA2_94122_c0~~gnl/MRDRNA2_/MRDRNA2_94122_c0_seq1.p1  ORF type:complete len:380 (+),score=72.31 gnl/MRDRNA2_/MRDRNA2_94122_c0_seq1:75-1142(+)
MVSVEDVIMTDASNVTGDVSMATTPRRADSDPTKATLPWVEKYRPQNLAEMSGHEDIIRTIQRMMDKNQLPHMLLHGPAGTGKTSMVLALAKTMYKNKFQSMTLELNASDARGIDVVRDQIKTFVSVKQLFSSSNQPKLVILDEADNMTSAAQFALRRMIEQYASNARFCLICNYSSKIIPALQSRCTKLRFAPLPESFIEERIKFIANSEGLKLQDDGAKALVSVSKGDMRRVLNIMQTTSMAHEIVDAASVYASTGIPKPDDIDLALSTLLSTSTAVAAKIQRLQDMLVTQGYSMEDMLQHLHEGLTMRKDIETKARLVLNTQLADIDWRLKQGCNERIQVAAVAGAFHKVRL